MPALRAAKTSGSRAHEVRRSGIHGRGLFAARGIREGERVVEYRGEIQNSKFKIENYEVEKKKMAEADGEKRIYIFEVGAGVYLDGEVRGNAARFINHSCAPNCEAVEEGGRIWMVAWRKIAAGEELTFDYGFRLGDAVGHRCRCGAAGCAGVIVNRHERWRVRRWIKRRGVGE